MSCQSSEMAARTTFPKKDGIICALVPLKAHTWAVTSLEIDQYQLVTTFSKKDTQMPADYDQDQKELKGTIF